MRVPLILLVLLSFLSRPALAWQSNFVQALKNGGALVENSQGETYLEHRSYDYFIPASTIKLATAYCAIKQFGLEHRFVTEFSLSKTNELYVRGFGDPFMVSEELALIANNLKANGLKQIRGIRLDTHYFAPNIAIDGTARSTNPYDALNGALIANFNTIYFEKARDGHITSAEEQTPLTPLARAVALKSGPGKHRVNLGTDPVKGARYFGELLQHFLKNAGIKVTGEVTVANVPAGAKLFYQHHSSKTLKEVVQSLLKFSTNFMANQLFLVMGAEALGAPATPEKGQRVLNDCLKNKVGWQDFMVVEGAGLSHRNRVTAQEMMQLLKKFEPFRELLPLEKSHFRAKTGTLNGVNTFAGYFQQSSGTWVRFVILVNSPVPSHYKFQLAEQLYEKLH